MEKKVVKKKDIGINKVLVALKADIIDMRTEITKTNQRIDRIVSAISKSKSVRGL